jgi:hypothetical protein
LVSFIVETSAALGVSMTSKKSSSGLWAFAFRIFWMAARSLVERVRVVEPPDGRVLLPPLRDELLPRFWGEPKIAAMSPSERGAPLERMRFAWGIYFLLADALSR